MMADKREDRLRKAAKAMREANERFWRDVAEEKRRRAREDEGRSDGRGSGSSDSNPDGSDRGR
jgi:hypothetical protein